MCTVSIIPIPGGLRLVSNRDEQRDRPPAGPPAWHHAKSTDAIWPTDPVGGGTWIAASRLGLSLCLLNVNLEPPPVLPKGLRSRGLVISQLIGLADAPAAADALTHMDLSQYAPFRLVMASIAQNPTIIDGRWDRSRLVITPHAIEPVCFASSGLGDSVVEGRLPLFDEMVRRATPDRQPAAQDAFHHHRWPDRLHASVLMSRTDARTLSSTTVELTTGPPVRVSLQTEPVEDDLDQAYS